MADMKSLPPRPADDSRSSDVNSRYLHDIHLKEGRELMGQKEYKRALDSFNKALEVKPEDEATLIARSNCYLQMGRRLRALRDVEAILNSDVTNPEALYAKAETLYQSGNYELSLIYFHRGLRQQPGSKAFQAGIQKSQEAVLKFGGGQRRGLRVCAVSDFNLYTRRKHWARDQRTDVQGSRSDVSPPLSDRTHDRSWRMTPDNFRSRFYCPLVRITKKPGIAHFRSVTNGSDRCSSQLSHAPRVQQSTVDEESLCQILGELDTDRKYLQNLYASHADKNYSVTDLAESGISFLQERGAYWDRLGPLPPPQPARRKYQRKSGSTLTSSTSSFQSNYSKSPRDVISTPSDINFCFETNEHVDDDGISVAMETDTDGGRSDSLYSTSEPTVTSFDENERDARKRELSLYIATELDAVARLYNQGRFSECQARAASCIAGVESLDDGELTDKLGNLATLHCYLGNAAAAMGQFSEAEYHHKRDLEIGDNDDMPDVTSRALGNLGRVYMSARKYNKALDVLAMKAPLCENPREVAWIFLEIGMCFVFLGHYDYARDCGRKVLKVSHDLDLECQRFQAQLLVASAQEKMKHYEDAIESYRVALETAKTRGDQMAECVIKRAIHMLGRKLAFSNRRINKGETTVTTPRDADHDGIGSLNPANRTLQDGTGSSQPVNNVDSRNANTTEVRERHTATAKDVSEGANCKGNGDPRNSSDTDGEYEGESVMSLMQRLREESNSYHTHPVSEYQEDVHEAVELSPTLDSTKGYEETTKRRPSMKKRASFRRKKSKAQFDRRISFKLWNEHANLFEDTLDDGESTARSKSKREKALNAIKQKSTRIRFQNVYRPLPRINTTRYCQEFVDGSCPETLDGNVVAAAIAESGFFDFVKLEHNVFSDDGDKPNAEVIKTNEIPSFIQKNNLLFHLSKKGDRIVFTPLESSEQDNNKWKVLYMRIRQGERQFTVPVADGQPEDETEKPRIAKEYKTETVQQVKQPQKPYPIRLGTKKQFKSKMSSNLGPVPEGRESMASPHTRKISPTTY